MKEALFLLLVWKIDCMIRLLFIPFFVLICCSCESDSKEENPLFYQMSEADSVRCMDEILGEIINTSIENQKLSAKFYNPNIITCGISDVFRVNVNSRGKVMVGFKVDSNNISEKVYDYFMFNRNLSSDETTAASIDTKYEGFDRPFYNRFGVEEVERKIEETQKQLEEIEDVEGADPVLVDYYASKVENWRRMLRSIELIGQNELSQVSPQAHVSFGFQKSSEKSEELFKQISLAFYYMRNYESMRYFTESYITLYDRSQRRKRQIDIEKLDVLELMYPSRIIFNNPEFEKMNGLYIPMPEQQAL